MNDKPLQPLRYGFPMKSQATPPADLHGSARWLRLDEAQAAGLFNPGGVVLGETRSGDMFSFSGDGHLLAFAPTGKGKGIGFVQPNLVKYPGSMIVLDPKGENVAVSARHRREFWKQRVVVLDPFGETGKPSGNYNPLAPLIYLPIKSVVGEIRSLAKALIPTRGGKDEAHWINGARMFIEALLLFMYAHEADNFDLLYLHKLAFAPPLEREAVFAALRQGGAADPDIARLCVALGNWWQGREEKERSYFLSIVNQELAWLGDTVWQTVLTGDASISPKTEAVTVYLVLPWLRLQDNRNWLRVMVASLLAQTIAVPGRPEVPVLFLLDEAYLGLGRMEIILEAAAILRSEGGRIALVYQDLIQLKSLYPDDWESFLANAGAYMFWAVNEMQGGRHVSERCGMETRFVPGSATGQGRQLRQASEVLTVPQDEVVCFFNGLHPARFGRFDVRTDSRFKPFLDPNPKQARVQPGAQTPGQPVRRVVPLDLAAIPNAPGAAASGNGDDWQGEEKPLPPLPHELQAEGVLLASLAAKYGRGDIFRQGDKFGYLDGVGFFVPVA